MAIESLVSIVKGAVDAFYGRVYIGDTEPTFVYDGLQWYSNLTGLKLTRVNDGVTSAWIELGPQANAALKQSKSVSILNPTNAEAFPLFYTTPALPIAKITAGIPGASGGPSVTYNVSHSPTLGGTKTNVIASGVVLNDPAAATSTTAFAAGTIPAGSWVWVTTSAKVGTVPVLAVTLEF